MAALTTTDLKAWLRVDGTTEDATIAANMASAVALLEREIHTTYSVLTSAEQAMFDVAEKLLVAQWHENRENVVTGESVNELPMGVQRIINLLQDWSTF